MAGRPEVIVDVVFEDGLLCTSPSPTSATGPALDVKTTFNRKLVGLGGSKDVAALAALRATSPYLAPGKEIRTLLDSTAVLVQRATREDGRTARVAYRDAEKKEYEGTMTHDLEIYRDIDYARGD